MNITFLSEGDTIFAVAENQKYRGTVHDELLYAEITFKNGINTIRWNDSFFTPEFITGSLDDAKRYVQQNHLEHKPELNSR